MVVIFYWTLTAVDSAVSSVVALCYWIDVDSSVAGSKCFGRCCTEVCCCCTVVVGRCNSNGSDNLVVDCTPVVHCSNKSCSGQYSILDSKN